MKTQIRVANYKDILASDQTLPERGIYHICDGIQSGNPRRLSIGNTSGTENGGSENGDTSNTDPLLHDLKPNDQLNTTASVELTRADTEEHRNV